MLIFIIAMPAFISGMITYVATSNVYTAAGAAAVHVFGIFCVLKLCATAKGN